MIDFDNGQTANDGPNSAPGDWHTLTLALTGDIVGCDQDLVHLLGSQADVLIGKPVRTFIPGIPFSAKTPGYNFAYAIVHGVKGARVRRTVRTSDGHGVLVDTSLLSRNIKGHRSIELKLRPSCLRTDGAC
ncbi:MAG: hypothetical protein K9K35_09750 [Rhodoferax sp.]|nr:hypothetical protein [Rhodoferax sp.]